MTFGALLVSQAVARLLVRMKLVYAGSLETFFSAATSDSLRFLPGRDLVFAAGFGLFGIVVVAARHRFGQPRALVRAGAGALLGFGLCIGQAYERTLLFRGDLPRFGAPATGVWHWLLYAAFALLVGFLAADLISRADLPSNDVKAS